MSIFKHKLPLAILVTILSFTACSAANSDQKEYGADAEYYMGLQCLKENKIDEAATRFERCSKKGSYYCAKKSAEELCKIGDIQQKNKAVLFLAENFRDSDSLLIAAKQLSSSKEINKLIEITENLDFKTEKNETIKLRLQAMKARCDSRYYNEVFEWFTCCAISDHHYQFYRDYFDHPDFDDPEVIYTPTDFAINYRIQLYRRDYSYTYKNADQILTFMKEGRLPLLCELASDIGKSYLYAGNNFLKSAQAFKQHANDYKGTDLEYYFWFYAGRFYDKTGNYFNSTKECFLNATKCANTLSQKDDALWYLLEVSKNFSVDTLVNSIGEYSKEFTNPHNFDNFFEALVTPLLVSGRWDAFKQIYTTLDGYASDDTVAQFAYIYGRLTQKGLGSGTKEDMEKAFRRACKSGSSPYYKILSAYELKLMGTDLFDVLHQTGIYENQSTDEDAERFLKGFAIYGYPELIYDNYMALYKNGISLDTAMYLADFLQKCADDKNNFYTQSLRIASRASFYANRLLTNDELKLIYPQDYEKIVKENCQKYEMNPSIMFGLIRSESFFDSQVVSSAGATGLTQLMDLTAGDVARRLKKSEYDLNDAELNVELGTWYLNNLYTRCDNSYLQAFFSYNGGINRVRRWLKGSIIEFGSKASMPEDLFLETVPINETREYGRKLVSAAVMYDYLYSNLDFQSSVQQLIKF